MAQSADNTSQGSGASRRGGRDPAFWLVHFERLTEESSDGNLTNVGWSCKNCDWMNRTKDRNATRLGSHAIFCDALPEKDFVRFMAEPRWAKYYDETIAKRHIAFGPEVLDRRSEPFFKSSVSTLLSSGPPSQKSEERYVMKRSFSDLGTRGSSGRSRSGSGDRPPSGKRPKTSSEHSSEHGKSSSGGPGAGTKATSPKLLLRPYEENPDPRISECSAAQGARILELLTRLIVVKILPFSFVEEDADGGNLFSELLYACRPGFTEKYMPSASKLSTTLLNGFYNEIRDKVDNAIKKSIGGSYATIMFDGWKDKVAEETVVNVLLRIPGPTAQFQQTYFLDAIFTGKEKVSSSKYVQIVEQAMERFGGLDRVCAVVSDSTSATRNARSALQRKYPHFVGIQDQSHAANLLLEDWGENLPWMKKIISKAQHICVEVKNHSKLFSAVKEEKEKFNKEVKSLRNASSDEVDGFGRPCLPKTAVLPTLKVVTRFASAVRMLKSYLRIRKVLQRVITMESFYSELYQARGTKKKSDRKNRFVDVIQCDDFFAQALDVYHVICLGEGYLRLFDRDDCRISDIYSTTCALQESIEKLPLTPFFTAEKKQEVLALFLKRKAGTATRDSQVKLLSDLHYASHLLDPTKWRSEDDSDMEMQTRFINHLENYLEGGTISDQQREELGVSNNTDLRTFLGTEFHRVRSRWEQAYAVQDTNWKVMICYKNSPALWWKHLAVPPLCSEAFQTLALRTLNVSPSSCAVERSFKTQKRIRSDVRNRLATEKVHKIMFCSWNYSLLNKEKEEVRSKLREQNMWAEGSISHGSATEWLKTVPSSDGFMKNRVLELADIHRLDESSPSHDGRGDRYVHEDSFEEHNPDATSEDGSNEEDSVSRELFGRIIEGEEATH